jgi:hypothetical protein
LLEKSATVVADIFSSRPLNIFLEEAWLLKTYNHGTT